jgi:hypothetical protein
MAVALDIDAIIADLTLPEKIMILSGAGACSTVPIPRLGIPKLHVRLYQYIFKCNFRLKSYL